MKGRLSKFLRKLRIDRDEYLKDMSEKTGVSIAFLSAVENETKKMTESLIQKIIDVYQLDKEEQDELRAASMEANKEATIYLDNLNQEKIDLTYIFARRIETIDENTLKKLKDILMEDINDWSYCYRTFNEENKG